MVILRANTPTVKFIFYFESTTGNRGFLLTYLARVSPSPAKGRDPMRTQIAFRGDVVGDIHPTQLLRFILYFESTTGNRGRKLVNIQAGVLKSIFIFLIILNPLLCANFISAFFSWNHDAHIE